MPDPYAVLGVAATATDRELAAAFRRRVREVHPDAPGGDGDRFAAVVAAYELLRDPRRRAEFDRRTRGVPVPVRRHSARKTDVPDVRAGPVRHHQS
ncbi:J domain-containing protein [Amycolatopsis sp. NPDC021455]|uniref:J domain-containing protein n=1 Tax=Amycolatopsis sp. NPDC021455 TaxID=3154901 RepID=UPI0034085715